MIKLYSWNIPYMDNTEGVMMLPHNRLLCSLFQNVPYLISILMKMRKV